MATRAAVGASALSVEVLKEKLRALGLKTNGNKAELIIRLRQADPLGSWANSESDDAMTSEQSETANPQDEDASETLMRRETKVSRKERELVTKELALEKREREMMRNMQHLNIGHCETVEENRQVNVSSRAAQESLVSETDYNVVPSRLNISSVAELLGYFDGRSDTYETWERQVKFLKNTYKLSDDLTKVMIGTRLRGKASEWLHSRPEYIAMSVNSLLESMKSMFHHRTSKILLRKQFEQRIWRRDETFSSYFHDKIIMANRIPVDDDEIIEYVIEGIPDVTLRDQARVQRLNTRESLLEAFERVSLRRVYQDTSTYPRKDDKAKQQKTEIVKKFEAVKIVKRCHNCGLQNHYAANCPMKDKGMKCFECQEFGHIASKCPSKNRVTKDSCNISKFASEKYSKETKIGDYSLTALIDTGSDLSLMRAEQYIRLGSPELLRKEIKFRGVGSQNNATLGEFSTNIEIDDNTYAITIHVVSDTLMPYGLLIGTDFLNNVEVIIKKGKIAISKPQVLMPEENSVPEIYKIDCVHEADEVDLSHVVNIKHRETVQNLIDSYNPVKVKETNVKMDIILKDNEPVFQTARRLSPYERQVVNAHIDEWLRDKIIEPSLSDYASPVVLVKKNNGGTRLCIDYRKLNKKVVKVRFPLPVIEDQINMLESANVFSTLDLKNGFFHVPIGKESRKFTSFIVPDGQFEFSYVPFGLCNSPSVFQKFINTIFSELMKTKKILIYIDDFIIFSEDYETGLDILKEVLNIAKQFGLKFNWKKCRFLQVKIEFLGHVIENHTVRPTEKKIEAVMNFPQPTNVKQNQSFLGLTGYFRKYVPNYSLIARPLTNLLKFDTKFHFGEKEKIAFNQLKLILCNQPVLRLYNPRAHTELHTDASMYGYGAILLQRDSVSRTLHPIYYASGKTSSAEMKYTSYELEVLAIVKSLKKFQIYLLGIPFKIVTDCQAFSLTMSKKDLCVRVARWALLLEEFEYVIEHRSGKAMSHVDALSRNPLPSTFLINESKDSIIARIRRTQQEDNTIRKMLKSADHRK